MTRRLTPLVLALAIASGAIARGGDDAVTRPEDWSPIVYPAQQLPLIFSHASHAKRGTSCTACHAEATTSRSAVDNLIPTELACRACHPIDRTQPDKVVAGAPPARCNACHPNYSPDRPVARVYLTPTPLKFSHAAHKAPCSSCHGDLTKVDLATRAHLPTMASCFTCHRDGAQERRCGDCHLTKLGGLIDTDLPHGRLVPRHTGLGDAHAPGFAKDHRQEARQVDATCTACHDQSTCLACHIGVTKPMDFHPGNYVLTHVVEARRGTPDCTACHRAQSFCVACHDRSGVTLRGSSRFSNTDSSRFHPSNWASSARGGAQNRHAGEARRNISSCASCHREDDCVKCHSAEPGSVRASPHPRGWRGSARCRALDRGNRRMCLKCHVTREELGCDWSAP